ncbi:MAG: tetratricopeptide repeat protein [Desulfuromonadales bacterium]|nr:tetratricopeptide repeat protein [Desulfuromonadales bacterium]
MRIRILCGLLAGILLTACVSVDSTSPPDGARYHYLMGVSALNENNPTEALRELLAAEKLDSRDAEIQAGLAEAYFRKEAYDLAERHYLRAIDLSAGDPTHHNNLGALYLNMERFDDAARQFQTAADNLLFDRPEIALTGLGLARFQLGDYPAAERAYQKALRLAPRYVQSSFRLGELYFAQDRPVEALVQFTRAVELSPNFVQAHYWLGLTYMKTEQPEAAKQAFIQVVKLAPDSEQARLALQYLKILN